MHACLFFICVFFPELNYLPPIYLSEGYSWMGCDSKATGATTYLLPTNCFGILVTPERSHCLLHHSQASWVDNCM